MKLYVNEFGFRLDIGTTPPVNFSVHVNYTNRQFAAGLKDTSGVRLELETFP
jgi:hypothetical protein